MTTEYICVFASSSTRLKPELYAFAEELGREIALAGYGLLFGGGRLGLMGAAADGAIAAAGRVVGVIPERLNEPGVAHPMCHELIVTGDMHARKTAMEEKCVAFIALPGGFGTLEELLEVITLRQLGYHDKPVVLCNPDGFYDLLLMQFEKTFTDGYADDAYRALYRVVHSPKEAVKYALAGECALFPDKMKEQMISRIEKQL